MCHNTDLQVATTPASLLALDVADLVMRLHEIVVRQNVCGKKNRRLRRGTKVLRFLRAIEDGKKSLFLTPIFNCTNTLPSLSTPFLPYISHAGSLCISRYKGTKSDGFLAK